MNAPRRSASIGLAAAGSIALLFACTSSKGPSQLEIKLIDAPNPAVDQIVVNVAKVTAHSTSGGWITVGPVAGPTQVNLLDLQTSALTLGLVNLPAGKITQVRLIIDPDGDYVVPLGTTTHEPLIVPSGVESGIKILGPWDVPECARLSVTLDFDGRNSIEYHPASGTWILRPVIRPTKDGSTAISCEQDRSPPPVCSVELPCPEGQVCVSGACAPSAPLATGSACTDGPQCLTGSCNDGSCSPGGAGAACGAGGDCASGSCIEGACSGGTALGARAACSSNGECLSGNCSGSACQPGLQGASCQSPGDCWSLTCTAGYCAPAPLPIPM